jgi:hypothetical protein
MELMHALIMRREAGPLSWLAGWLAGWLNDALLD